MLIKDLTKLNELRLLHIGDENNEVKGIFACDLLSHVMGHAKEQQILITVLNNINVLGVVNLLDLSGVIFTHDTEVNEAVINKAKDLNIPLFVTPLPTAEIVITLKQFGV
jgi:serine kinase of HPr protein (carbohydrate metabolism regulator)